jgi:hypothetical protein
MSTAIATAKPRKVSKRGRVGEGRPSKYAEWMIPVVREMGMLGATLQNLANALQVDDLTVSRWMDIPEFGSAVREVRDDLDARVERSLFERAMGFEHASEKVFCNAKGEVSRADTRVKYAPDTQAAIFWLKNRQPKKWREKLEVQHGVSPEGQNMDAGQVVDGLVALAIKHPIAAVPLRTLLQSALDRIPVPE